ncbi:angiopoietin-related protein 7-like [Cherax quadricarinatus]
MKADECLLVVWLTAVLRVQSTATETAQVLNQHLDYVVTFPEDPLQPIWDRLDSMSKEIFKDLHLLMETHVNKVQEDIGALNTKISALEDKIDSTITDFRLQIMEEIEDKLEIVKEIEDKLEVMEETVEEELSHLAWSMNSSSSSLASINTHLSHLEQRIVDDSTGDPDNCSLLVDKVSEVMNDPRFTNELHTENDSRPASTCLDEEEVRELKQAVASLRESPVFLPRDCSDHHWQHPEAPTGVFQTFPTMDPKAARDSWCDMGTNSSKTSGGWTLILRRRNTTWGLVDFNRTWAEYRRGFGTPGEGEWWFGLGALHALTYRQPYEVRFLMHDMERGYFEAKYSNFRVEDESSNFRLITEGFSGNVSVDPFLTHHHGRPFSTWDRDNDEWIAGSCSASNGGGWWYSRCHRTALTAVFPTSPNRDFRSIRWLDKGWLILDDVAMMIRPSGYARRFEPQS